MPPPVEQLMLIAATWAVCFALFHPFFAAITPLYP